MAFGTLGKWRALNSRVNKQLNLIGVFIIFFLMFLIVADVTGRYLWNTPILGTYDIGQSLIVIIVFFGFPYTQKIGGNIRVESVISHFSPRLRLSVEVSYRIVALLLFMLITYGTWEEAWTSWQKREAYLTLFYGGVLLPIYPSKFAVPIGSLLLCFQFFFEVLEKLSGSPGQEDSEA
jgi:TRAP-type C4-dicarboxylate transport system permease small subunit